MLNSNYIPHDATVFPNTIEKSSIKSLVDTLKSDYPMFFHSHQGDSAFFNFIKTKTTNELFIGCEGGSIIEYNLEKHEEKSIYKYHTKGVVNLKISTLDSYLLSASHDCTVAVFDVILSKFIKRLNLSPAVPETICFTLDEETACVGSDDSVIRIWKFLTNDKETQILAHSGPIITLLIVKEKFLASSSQDGTLKLWKIASLKEKGCFQGHKTSINCFIISHKQDLVASGGGNSVKLWNLRNFEEISSFFGHVGEIYSLAFNFDDSLLASGSQDRTVRVWNLKSKSIQFIQENHQNFISFLRFVGNNLLVSSSYRYILVDNLSEKRTEVVLEGHTGMITQMEVFGSQIISCSFDRTVKFWDINDQNMKTSLNGHGGNVSCILITNDYNFVVSGGWDGLVVIWKLKECRNLHSLKAHTHYVSCLEQTNDGKKVLSASWDSTIKVWDVFNGILIQTFKGPAFSIHRLKISFFSDFVGCCSGDYKAWFWSLGSFDEVSCLAYSDFVSFMDFNLNDVVVLSVLDGTLDSYDLKKKKILNNRKFQSEVFGFRFTSDYKKIIVVLSDKSFKLVDADSFQILSSFFEHFAKWPVIMNILSYSYFTIISNGVDIKIFDIERKVEFFTFKSIHPVQSCVTTGCGNFIIVGTMTGTIIIFNVSEKREEATFKGHTDLVGSLGLTESSKYLISGSRDTTLKVWKLSQYLKELDHSGPEETNSNQRNSQDNRILSHRFCSSHKEKMPKSFESYAESLKIYPALVYNGFRQRFCKKLLPVETDCKIMMAGQINLAHLYCYLGYFQHLEKALKLGCPIRRDLSKNSPLYYAISKDSQKSSDVILKFLIDLSKSNEEKFFEYTFALRDDLLKILKLSSSLVPQFLESIFFLSKDKSLPNSVRCFVPPVMILTEHSKIYFKKFKTGSGVSKICKKSEHFIEYRTTPFELELTHGSQGFFQLIRSLTFSKNKKIFTTKLIKTILDYKFKTFFKLILGLSFVLAFELILMIFCISVQVRDFSVILSFFTLNSFMLIHEFLQVKYEGLKYYLRCSRNLLDLTSVLVSLTWVFFEMTNKDFRYLKWLMVFLNFLKGLNIFKAFNATRFYIALLKRVTQETYSFLIIFMYSTVAFGGLFIASVGQKFDNFHMLWKIPYELNFGVFEASHEPDIEYFYFVLASLLNIVMMLNLLIAILSDSFDKFQIEALESDYREKMDVIARVESLCLLGRVKRKKGFLQLCDLEIEDRDQEAWGGKIKEIQMKVERISKDIQGKFKVLLNGQSNVALAYERIEEKIEKKHDEFEKMFGKIEEKLDKILNK